MNSAYFTSDFQEFLKALFQHDVHYLIVGGEAVIYYGYPRLTGDMDIYYDRTEENVEKLWKALDYFWGGNVPQVDKREELMQDGLIIQFGVSPNRIDLINRIEDVTFQDAWESRISEKVRLSEETVPVYYIGLDALIRNKERVARPKDQEDLKYLMALKNKLNIKD